MKISSSQCLQVEFQFIDWATFYSFALNQSNIFTLEFVCCCINFFKQNLLDNQYLDGRQLLLWQDQNLHQGTPLHCFEVPNILPKIRLLITSELLYRQGDANFFIVWLAQLSK